MIGEDTGVLLKHGQDGNDRRDGKHECTIVIVVPSLTEPGDL